MRSPHPHLLEVGVQLYGLEKLMLYAYRDTSKNVRKCCLQSVNMETTQMSINRFMNKNVYTLDK